MLRFAAAKNPYILSLGSAASRREEIRGGLNGFGLRINHYSMIEEKVSAWTLGAPIW